MEIHIGWVLLAALGAFVCYMVMGFALFAAMPGLKAEFKRYPGVYRDEPEMMKRMPLAMVAIAVSVFALAVLYAHMTPWGAGWMQGGAFGVLIGVFALCVSVIHNHVNLNIGWALTIQSGIAYFVQWVVVGVALGIIYR
jgi:hypothetical protein